MRAKQCLCPAKSKGRAAEAERQHKIESRLAGSIISCEFETADFNFNSKEDMRNTGMLEYECRIPNGILILG